MFRIAWANIGAVGTIRMFVAALTPLGRLDRVGDDQALHHGILDPFDRRAGQDAVGDVAVNLGRAVLHQHLGRLAQRAGGVADVIDDDAGLVPITSPITVISATSPAFSRRLSTMARGALIRVASSRARATPPTSGDTTIRLVHPALEVVLDVQREDRGGIKVVHRNIEEALDLRRVQVERQDAFHPCLGDQVGDQLGRDRGARLGAAVLPGIAEIGDHGGDARRR